MTYREAYEEGRTKLAAAGILEAELDARLLLQWICHTDTNQLLVHGDRPVEEEQLREYRDVILRRSAHEPLQHITGVQEFMGLPFSVNREVLIPRQDTEILVEEVMRYLHDGMEILDLCTGSGCILLSLLHYSNDCRGVGADISKRAIETAVQNAEALQIAGSSFLVSDLFDSVGGSFDLIVSNPPYIKTEDIAHLMEEVRDFEPTSALDGRADGLAFYREITKQAPQYLKKGGYLFYEIGFDQAEEVSALLQAEGFKEIRVVKDYAGHDRVVSGLLGCLDDRS